MSDSATMEAEVAATVGSPVKKVDVTPSKTEPALNGDSKDSTANGEETPKTPKKEDEKDAIASAKTHFAAGKRCLLIQDPEGAVTSLATACEKFGKIYGETAKECGDAYFYYGKALLEMARVEAGVIDNVLDGVPDTEDEEESSFVEGPKPTDEERNKISDDVGKAIVENYTELEELKKKKDEIKTNGHAKSDNVDGAVSSKKEGTDPTGVIKAEKMDVENGSVKTENGHAKDIKKEDEKMDVENQKDADTTKKDSEENSTEEEEEDEEEAEEGKEENENKEADKENDPEAGTEDEGENAEKESIGSNEAGPSDAKESTDKVAQAQEEEEDPSNLQLAWEMLELAKSVMTKHADSLEATDEKRLELEDKLSEIYQTLGEVSIENENYPQAIEDLTMCLRRRQDLNPEDSRVIAETHYQLGVALGFNAQFDEAVNALNDAINVLEKRVANLKEKKESREPSKKDDPTYDREKEIKEIEGLIPEIREKIVDTKDMKAETFKKIGDRRLLEDAFAAAASANNDKNGDTVKEISPKKAPGNITHLVKKRKKSEEEAEKTENGSPKKPHLETNGTNGSSASTSNGH